MLNLLKTEDNAIKYIKFTNETEMTAAFTVNQLLEECERLKQNGLGNKHILISSDDEGNEYHELLFLFTPITKTILKGSYVHADESDDNIIKNYLILG